jgi:tetratricopeptide (TPR) repeat protein
MPLAIESVSEIETSMFDEHSSAPLLDKFYHRFLNSERSAEFIYNVSRHYTIGSLEKLAFGGSRVTRRGAVLAIGFLGDISSNPVLGQKLQDDDRAVRLLADHGIRQLWTRVGNLHTEATLRQVARLNQQQLFATGIDLASELLDISPQTAEAWNQRAIAWYSLEDYRQAVSDCRRAIELNPWHFLAALGSANCQLELGDVIEALQDFRLALKINPDLEMVRSQVSQLQRIVEGG